MKNSIRGKKKTAIKRNSDNSKVLGVITIAAVLMAGIALVAGIRGNIGHPTITQLSQTFWRENGPLELSPERGRFALTYSIVEDKSVIFSLPVAKFATPDLGYKNGNYVSLFAPGISFLIIPGYLLGAYFGSSQVGAYGVITLFAFINFFLIRSIAMRLGASSFAATIGGFIFLFGSPAFAYAVSLYQHHVSTFLILMSLYLLLRFKNVISLTIIWILCAVSLPIDYPNLFLMFPIGLLALSRLIFAKKEKTKQVLTIRTLGIFTFVGAILPLAFFLWFNQISYGNPFQLSGTIGTVKQIDKNGKPVNPEIPGSSKNITSFEVQDKSAIAFFKTRNITNGLMTHFISRDRGILWFTPVMFLSFVGGYVLLKRKTSILPALVGIVGANILLYSMWGDPYGGWAFGSRYLIPSYAILSIFIAVALTIYRRNIVFLTALFILLVYSIFVNTLGALTSNQNPPQVEVLGLEAQTGRVEPYSYDRNYQYLEYIGTKSYVYKSFLTNYMDPKTYYYVLAGSINSIAVLLLVINCFIKPKEDYV